MNYLRTKKLVGGALIATMFVVITPASAMAANVVKPNNVKVVRVETETSQSLDEIAPSEKVKTTISDVVTVMDKAFVAKVREDVDSKMATNSNAVRETTMAIGVETVANMATSSNAVRKMGTLAMQEVPFQASLEKQKIKEVQKSIQVQTFQKATTPKLTPLGVFKTTGYCPCRKCCGGYKTTSTGTIPRQNHTIAVDPRVIPYGSLVMINGNIYVAEDTGVKNKHIDVFYSGHNIAKNHGVQYAQVFLVTL